MALRIPPDVARFAKLNLDVEVVVQRIGRDTWDLVLIDPSGNWTRAIFPSKEQALAAAEFLGTPVHEGWDERMSQRMNRRDHWGQPGGQRRAL